MLYKAIGRWMVFDCYSPDAAPGGCQELVNMLQLILMAVAYTT